MLRKVTKTSSSLRRSNNVLHGDQGLIINYKNNKFNTNNINNYNYNNNYLNQFSFYSSITTTPLSFSSSSSLTKTIKTQPSKNQSLKFNSFSRSFIHTSSFIKPNSSRLFFLSNSMSGTLSLLQKNQITPDLIHNCNNNNKQKQQNRFYSNKRRTSREPKNSSQEKEQTKKQKQEKEKEKEQNQEQEQTEQPNIEDETLFRSVQQLKEMADELEQPREPPPYNSIIMFHLALLFVLLYQILRSITDESIYRDQMVHDEHVLAQTILGLRRDFYARRDELLDELDRELSQTHDRERREALRDGQEKIRALWESAESIPPTVTLSDGRTFALVPENTDVDLVPRDGVKYGGSDHGGAIRDNNGDGVSGKNNDNDNNDTKVKMVW